VLVQRSQPLLGTFVTVTVYARSEEAGQKAISAAFDEIRRVDGVLSVHNGESEVSRVNRLAAEHAMTISAELVEVLRSALRISAETEGAFDVTIGPLAQLWGFIWKEYRLPTRAELERTLPLVGYQQVSLRKTAVPDGGMAASVQFARNGMFLDFGGIGKGYAVDRAMAVLRQEGIRSAMVKAGGDLRVMGTPPGQRGWEVQIEDPRKEGKRASIVLRDQALSTSGNYENYFEVDGKRYSHIIDPRSGIPIAGMASCTVIGSTCLETDAYATAFFVIGIDESLQKFGGRFGIRFLDADLKMHETPDFPAGSKR
jgi:FAD:protein FMN transferase